MKLILIYVLLHGLEHTSSALPDNQNPKALDFINIEVGSKYTVDSKANDIFENRNEVITFEDIMGNSQPAGRLDNGFVDSVTASYTNGKHTDDTIVDRQDRIPYENLIFKRHEVFDLDGMSLVPTISKGRIDKHANDITNNTLSERTMGSMFATNTEINETETVGQKNAFQNSSLDNSFDIIKQIKLGVIKSLKYYDKVKADTTLFKMDNVRVNLVKKPRILPDNEAVVDARNVSSEELDKQLIDNFMKTVQSHQINLDFSSDSDSEGLINKLVSMEGRDKKKHKKGGHGVGLAASVALAMTLGGLMFIKMITMKALMLSLLSMLISLSNRKGGGHSRQIEAKFQADPDLAAPLCNCKCPGSSSAYKLFNDHKNSFISVDPHANEFDGTEYVPQLAFKNILIPGPPRYNREDSGE